MRENGAGEGNRTLVFSLEGSIFTERFQCGFGNQNVRRGPLSLPIPNDISFLIPVEGKAWLIWIFPR